MCRICSQNLYASFGFIKRLTFEYYYVNCYFCHYGVTVNFGHRDIGDIVCCVVVVCVLCMYIINPRRACAARVTVVVLCVCLSVCPRLFSDYRLRGGL